MNKPFQSYNGGKESDGTYQKIINRIPPHDGFLEMFLGNGTIFRYLKPASWSIGIDLDTEVINQWLKITPRPTYLLNTDAISFLEHFLVLASILKNSGQRIFIYLDPPYPKSCRKSDKNLYNHELTDEQHEQLLCAVQLLKDHSMIMISSYPNELYDTCLADWHTTTFQSQTRNGTATEKLWTNYPEPIELHDYRYLGNDYREREQIKGIVKRNTDKLKRMPTAWRNALLENLKDEELI